MRCDGGATRTSPCLAPVLARPVPFTCSEGDRERRNTGSEAGRCCGSREEEGQCLVAAGSTLQRTGCKVSAVMDTVLLVDAIKCFF